MEDKREKYPKYFEGLQTLSDYQKKLDDALEELKKTNEELGNVKNKTGKSVDNIKGRGSTKNANPPPIIMDERTRLNNCTMVRKKFGPNFWTRGRRFAQPCHYR